MKTISEIDSNFKISIQIEKEGKSFYNIDNPPFKVYGVFKDEGKYRRLPENIAKSVSEGVHALHANTAGGRVRFKTDSACVSIIAKMGNIGKMPHFALTGSVGFDMYVKEAGEERYAGTFIPPFDITDEYESCVTFDSKKLRDITINFPLYSEVADLYIGVENGSFVGEPEPYTIPKPVVYYGSSITQGGCASRAGTSYQSIISRRFDCDYINLGFSGNAKAEDEIIDYIKKLDMSMFVYDYDYNAPSVEHLANTHEKMFKAVRKENPQIPIIFMSRPKYYLDEEEEQRLNIIKTTYNNALSGGDRNVYLLDGKALMSRAGSDGTVDNAHPNDLGFASMAEALGNLIETII